MPDVNFLPIHKALFSHNVVDVYFDERQLAEFEKSTIHSHGRASFEKGQLENDWAREKIKAFLDSGGTEPLCLADQEHPLRFGGSALTILDIDSGPLRGQYWIGTARFTNKGFGRGRTGPDVGKFKNAGGVPSTQDEHLDPTAIGAKEGVEEIAFCSTSEHESRVFCPQNIEDGYKRALNEAIARLNGGSYLSRKATNKDFSLHEHESYTMDAFPPTGQTLKVHVGNQLRKLLSGVVLSWTPQHAALEVAAKVFRLRLADENALAAILTADGPDESLERFAEDVYVVKLCELQEREAGDVVSGYSLETTKCPNWPPVGPPKQIEYRPAGSLRDLLDAFRKRYSFVQSLRRVTLCSSVNDAGRMLC